jgi:alkylated DNA repair dioxygenase AlkB
MRAASLFEPDLPAGFVYRESFIAPGEESRLVDSIQQIEFANFEMRGIVARRRVAFFGRSYDESLGPERPIPSFLTDLRARAAELAHVDPEAFVMALINEYRSGAPIGWHRDAPQYGIVTGISLLSSCRMKFRPYVPPAVTRGAGGRTARKTTHEITLMPRSGYLMTGAARQDFEHSIPAVEALRYSITFRTLRR